jgi:deazaflavin-dependent oxidoreductase (nitroreductase family)
MDKANWMDRMYAWGEGLLMHFVPQHGVGPIMKWVFKFPILFHRIGLGWMMKPYVLLLITKGRRTGKARWTPVEYQYDRSKDRYYVMAGWEGTTDWYRNLRRAPHVEVVLGRRRFKAIAEPASDEETAEKIMALTEQRPFLGPMWQRWCDRPIDGSRESYIYAARFFPAVWVRPLPATGA